MIKARLLPKKSVEYNELMQSEDPYDLRRRGLDEKLSLYQIGRALYHMNQRRGFKSNRKTDGDEDSGTVKPAITELAKEMEVARSRTLGQHLAQRDKKRGQYTGRSMYEEEFDLFYDIQAAHYPSVLTEKLKTKLHKIIFFQRPLKSQKHLIGNCTFEKNRHRAAVATLAFQQFRFLQTVNQLEILNPSTHQWRKLTEEERSVVIKAVENRQSMTWNSLRKQLKLHDGEVFNLEDDKRDKILGNRTAAKLHSILKKRWDKMTPDQREQLVTDLLTIDQDEGLRKRLRQHWEFDSETIAKLAKLDLTKDAKGFGNLSTKALRKINEHLATGLLYDDACEAAGYNHAKPGGEREASELLGSPPDLRNPVVIKGLWETRKVVNSLIRAYGKPDVIRIEMARDVKNSEKRRKEIQKQQTTLTKKREETKNILGDLGIPPTREAVLRYHLWEECGHQCPYTGQMISKEMLFGGGVDIEHITPYSRSLDDSYMNKSLCMPTANREIKRNQTPWEAWGQNEKEWCGITQRVRASKMPRGKKLRFLEKESKQDDFFNRQLNDTRYLSREAKGYLEELGASVQVSPGRITAGLRHVWGLNHILAQDGSGEKNRADHRHHAIDAFVIAATSRSLLQRLSTVAARLPKCEGLRDKHFDVPQPWPGFAQDVARSIGQIVISHAPLRKLHGALHEETAYGIAETVDEKGRMTLVYRVRLETITANQVERIRDGAVRELVKRRIAQHSKNPNKPSAKEIKAAFTEPLLMTTKSREPGPRIETVRITQQVSASSIFLLKDEHGNVLKAFPYGSNHHVEIIENVETGKREGRFVTMLEAARRARIEKKPIVQRDHGPEWKFIMALHINDMVEVTDEETGELKIFRVQKISGANNRINLRHHSSATLDDSDLGLQTTPNTLKGNLIQTDPIGCVRTVGD